MSTHEYGTCPSCGAPLMQYRNRRGETVCIDLECRWSAVTGNPKSNRIAVPDDYLPEYTFKRADRC